MEQLDMLLGEAEPNRPTVRVLVPTSLKSLPRYRHLLVQRVGRFSGQVWEQFELPFYARGSLLFTPCGGAPLLHRRNVITIHDAAVFAAPRGYSIAFRVWYQFLYWTLCHSALHVLTVSHFSKSELVKWCGADPKRISVIYLGCEHALRPEPDNRVLEKNLLRRFGYVLCVGSRNPNKNLAGLLRALPYLTAPGIQIALAGQNNAKVFGRCEIDGERIHNLGYIDDSELRTLYENAACFVFPSFYEGFGLPPLEALALGCPTVVANSGSLAELFGGIAFLCDPYAPSDIADNIRKACQVGEENRTRNREFGRNFRWQDCAEGTWKVITRLSNR
jgi:glycosyltransferase involved in cell wall biosynthesis